MTTTAVRVTDIPPLEHDEAMALAGVEYDRLIEVAERLTPTQWAAPTDCAGWDVRAVVGHLLGMIEMDAEPTELGRQVKAATERMQSAGGPRIDSLTAIQVEEHASLTIDELLAALRSTAPRALAARTALSVEERARPYDPGPPFQGPWTRGYLLDVIHTRDPFMHRVDIARATGTPLALTPEHDGRIVADVVAEWARRHGQDCTVVLTGPAGGTYVSGGGGGEHHELDAIEFCRLLAGRGAGPGLLRHQIAF
jgi:uncharacterized protein (TIGR03083 family)